MILQGRIRAFEIQIITLIIMLILHIVMWLSVSSHLLLNDVLVNDGSHIYTTMEVP